MKILVTGGAGYAGSIVTRFLLAAGHQVRVLDSLLHGEEGLVALHREEGFQFFRGDICSLEDLERSVEGMGAVVHLAALVGDPACARQPERARHVNYEGSLRLFEVSKSKGVGRFIYASTCSNYGKMRDPSVYLTEDSELAPVSLYAETKVDVERALLGVSHQGSPVVTVLRFATMFGLSPRMRFDLTVNEFTMELLTKRTVTIYGEQFWRPYVHVRDVASAIALVLEAPGQKVQSQAFNVGDTTQNFQKIQLVEMIRKQLPHPIDLQIVKKEEDPRDYRVSFEKIARVLGFGITQTVEQGIQEIRDALTQGVLRHVDDPRYRN